MNNNKGGRPKKSHPWRKPRDPAKVAQYTAQGVKTGRLSSVEGPNLSAINSSVIEALKAEFPNVTVKHVGSETLITVRNEDMAGLADKLMRMLPVKPSRLQDAEGNQLPRIEAMRVARSKQLTPATLTDQQLQD